MLSSCGGRLISGGGNSSLSSSSSTSAQRHASQAELLASSSSTSSCCNSNEASLNNGGRNLPSGQLGQQWPSSRYQTQEQWRQEQNDLARRDEFISVNGAIFTLTNNRQQQPPPRTKASSYLLEDDVDIARRPDSRAPLPPPPPLPEANSNGPKPINRQHHYRPIHQQLQRIYGNKLQEFEQINRQQKLTKTAPNNKRDSSNERQATKASSMIKQLEHVFAPADGRARNQHQLHQQQQHQSAIYNLSDSRAYDSLNEQAMLPPEPPEVRHPTECNSEPLSRANRGLQHEQQVAAGQHQHVYQQDFYDLERRRPHLSAMLPPGSMPRDDHLARSRLARNSYEPTQHEVAAFEDEDDEEEEEHEDDADCNRPALVENEEEQGLLLGDAGRIDQHSSRLLMNNRKKQMESLHYATATAAALLNVTASAAAAFVASDKNLTNSKPSQQQHQSRRPRPPPQSSQKRSQHSKAIATGPKPRQDTKRSNLGLIAQQNIRQYQQLYEFGGDQLRQQRNQMQQVALSTMQLGPIYQQQQQQNRVGAPKASQQLGPQAQNRPPQSARSQLQQLNPARLDGGALTIQQLDLLRRYKQQTQLQLSNSQQAQLLRPSRSITNCNNNSILNNKHATASINGAPAAAMAILQAPDKQSDANLMAHLAAKYQQQQQILTSAVDPQLLMLASGQIQNASAVAKLREELQQRQQQQVTYGLLVAARADKRRPPQPIYAHAPLQLRAHLEQQQAPLRQSHYQIGAVTSNSSGRSDAPLILNRSLVKADKASGLLDKISHINLTVFWWVLLAISVLFITLVIGITRYLT